MGRPDLNRSPLFGPMGLTAGGLRAEASRRCDRSKLSASFIYRNLLSSGDSHKGRNDAMEQRPLFMFRGGAALERGDGAPDQAQVKNESTTTRSTKAYFTRQSRRAIEKCGVRLTWIAVRTFLEDSGQWLAIAPTTPL